jgi:hypothetical protein
MNGKRSDLGAPRPREAVNLETHQNIRILDQSAQDLFAGLLFEVKRQATLPAVHLQKVCRLGRHRVPVVDSQLRFVFGAEFGRRGRRGRRLYERRARRKICDAELDLARSGRRTGIFNKRTCPSIVSGSRPFDLDHFGTQVCQHHLCIGNDSACASREYMRTRKQRGGDLLTVAYGPAMTRVRSTILIPLSGGGMAAVASRLRLLASRATLFPRNASMLMVFGNG